MVMLPEPKFFGNTADDSDCVPCCWRMALETYFPDQKWPLKKIKAITRKIKGEGSWEQPFYSTAIRAGCNLHVIAPFSDEQFVKRGIDYIAEVYCAEEVERLKKVDDIPFIRARTKQALLSPYMKCNVRAATITDIKEHLAKGSYVLCGVNDNVMAGIKGRLDHAVLVYGIKNGWVYFHDPGLPPRPRRRVRIKKFARAFYSPSRGEAAILAISKRPATLKK
ncbi:MAG: hypothetical protein AB7G06_08480 [Bdellovibrionales bacterium]